MSNDSKDELTLRIGEKLTAARIESGYTQSRAARAVGTSQSCISAVEHGKKQNVNIIIALIKLYGVSYEDVFGLVKVSFGIMGTSGMHTPYQMSEAYSIYIMTYGQYYALTVACGYIASLLAASLAMLVAAKMHTISVAVCIPFFLYCLLPFIGRVLSSYTKVFNLIPTILTNVEASVRVPLLYQIGTHVIR